MKSKKLNKKAFTLIELLGVIVIIGILSTITIVAVSKYFNQSREQKNEQNKNNIIMAAEMYYQANRDLLPKGIGESTEIDLRALKKAKYLKSDVTNDKDESCMERSSVRVVKLDEDYYSYLANLYCGDETPDDISDTIPSPVVENFKFTDKNSDTPLETGKDDKFTDIKNARFTFTIKGSPSNKNIGVYSYYYSILIKDASFDEYTEVFNSGTIKGGSEYSIDVKSQPLSNYIDLTGKVSVMVRVYVMNDQGMYINYSSDSDSNSGANSYEDTVAPLCGNISGDAYSDDEWTNKSTYSSGSTTTGRTRGYPSVLTVQCNDGDGSGCKRVDFSKSWPTKSKNELGIIDYNYGARWAYVVLEDNSVNINNKANCSKTLTKSALINDASTGDIFNVCNKYVENKGKKDELTVQNGNKRVCYVRVNVDVQAPTIDLKVYKAGTNEEVASLKVEDSGPTNTKTPEGTIKSTGFKGSEGVIDNEQWLNLKNFPEGIEISADVADNLYLYRWTWETSDSYLPFSTADSTLVASASLDNAKADGTAVTSGYFKSNVDNEIVTNIDQFEKNEHGALKGEIKGLKLRLEGKRYGRLTVYDKAGNPTILHIYANIDRTPPLVPDMSHTKIGATAKSEDGKVTINYPASGDKYDPADKNNFKDNNRWSREKISTFVEGQRDDRKATDKSFSDRTLSGDLSGWWKFTYVYEMQDPNKKKYSWKKAVEKDAVETIKFEDEGTHKVRIRSCDKAKNCSIYSPDDYLKIDYTLPKCGIKETFTNTTGYNENGWLKKNETVLLSHICDDPKSNISSNCNPNSKFNQQTYLYNFDVETDKAGANGFINPTNNEAHIKNENLGEWYDPDKPTPGGHVVDYAGNIIECGVKTVKIDYITPKCFTKITYGVNGDDDPKYGVKPKNPSNETGWLSLYKGGIDQNINSAKKETATVSHDCEDPKSESRPMLGVHSKCDTKTYKHTVYNWELRTTIAGALGVGQGGEIADLAGNIAQCPADRTINIDYTQPKCNTIIEYPQGSPINQTDTDIESGWLGYNDNVNCLNGKLDYSYRNGGTASGVTGSANQTGLTTPASSSNIKGEGNVKTVTHRAYLSPSVNANGTVTRAKFAEILCKALDVPAATTYTNMYKDVTQSTEYWQYILAASQQGFFVGVGEHNFSPTSPLKRAELASAIMRAVAARGVTSDKSCAIQFTDYPQDAWYAEDLRAASNNCFFVGIGTNGNDIYAAPTKDATVAQIATVIYGAFRKEDESGCKDDSKNVFDVSKSTLSPLWAKEALADATTNHTCTNGVEASGLVGADGSITLPAYVDNRNFDYSKYTSRQEFLKMFYNAVNVQPSTPYNSRFSDVSTSNAYWRYIIDAAERGYMVGYGNGIFSPTSSISRAEAITAIVRIMKDKGLSTGKTCSTNIPDLDESAWYADDMKTAAGMCILVGDENGMYNPKQYASNMETITILYRAFRDHDGLNCKIVDGNKDYDSTMVNISQPDGSNVPTDFWGYEFLKDATTEQKCGGSLIDPATKNDTKTSVPDTRCDQKVDEKKTAVITQICTELSEYNSSTGQNGVTSGCYGSMKNSSSSIETRYQSKLYNFEVNTTKGGAVDVGNNGYIVDVAGNITNCDTPENWHTVKIDYTRPSCKITATYIDRRTGKSGDYLGSNAHFLGKNSSVTIQSLCGSDGGGSNCWEEKNSTFTYTSEIKTDNGTSKPNLAKAYIYDLAGNRSEVCPVNKVQIDHTGPVCKTHARYKKATSIPKTDDPANDPTDVYDPNKVLVPNWESGWLDEHYTVRVISYCEKDEVKNVVQASNSSGAGCKGATASPKIPDGEKNQRSYNDYHISSGFLNEPKGAKPAGGEKKDEDTFYEHKAYSIGGVTRINFAKTLLDAVGIDVESGNSHPFTDAGGNDDVIGTVYKYGLMIGTSSTTFNPNKELTRAEMIVAVMRASHAQGITYSKTCNGSFTDYTKGSNLWFSSDIEEAVSKCILVGFGDSTLRPGDIATPDQVYAVIDRALRPHEEGYKCTPDVISNRKDNPWNFNGNNEKVYHKCVKTESANTAGAKHVIYDDVGNKTTCDDIQIKLDASKPTCNIEPSGYVTTNGGYYWSKREAITVTKKCSDTGSGCSNNATLTKNKDCNKPNATATYNPTKGPFSTTEPNGGDSETRKGDACKDDNNSGIVVDGVGHEVSCTSPNIGFDQKNPSCTYDAPYHNTWVNHSWSVTEYCNDGYTSSGCKENSSAQTISGEQNQTITHTWNVYDNVNNLAVCKKDVTQKIDMTKPTISCTAGYSSTTSSISLTLSTPYNVNNGSYNSPYKSLYTSRNAGSSLSCGTNYTITATVTDQAGNSNSATCSTGTTTSCCAYTNVKCGSCGSYGACSASCGYGTKYGTKTCGNYSNYNSSYCSSAPSESCSSSCYAGACPPPVVTGFRYNSIFK